MIHRLQRHPFAVEAHFERTLVLTYALPTGVLESLLPPGLTLDRYGPYGFIAVAMVQTRRLHPAWWPACAGLDFGLTGYRIFARYRTRAGRTLRGLRILRSDTDRWTMVLAGNALTHYHYRRARMRWRADDTTLRVRIDTPRAAADVDVTADLAAAGSLPAGSVFRNAHDARQFAGPLPFTFDY
ncbi:MAG TPA: DUF2071 domain-containing protein, partial [Phycisphaerae bacterium]|nr:DUF2071 domain-containing protein [Phycisphaerae bacterium]